MELQMKIPQRVEWIDIFKGIAIFLMVIGHAASPFNGYIYLFHMGAFLFISGYTSKLNKVSLDVLFIKKSLGLLLPYYFISIISIFMLGILNFLGIYHNLFSNNYIEVKEALNLLFEGYNVSNFLGATWFLIVLFNVFIVQKVLLLCSKDKIKYLYFFLSLCLFLIGYYFVKIKVSSPKLMIDLVFIAQFYFCLGVIANKFSSTIKNLKNKNILYWILTLISIGLLYYFKNINYSGVDYPSREFGNIFNNFLATMSGIIVLILTSTLLIKTNKLKKQLILFGKNTLGILFFHFLYFKLFFIMMAIMFHLEKDVWFVKQIPEANNIYWLIISLFSIYLSIFSWKFIRKSEFISIFLGTNRSFNIKIMNKYQRFCTNISILKRRRFELFKKETYLRIFNIVFIASFMYILFEVLFNEYTIYWTKQNMGLLIIGVILSLYLIFVLYKNLKKLSKRGLYYVIGCSMFAILGLQIVFAMKFKVNPTWDFGIIYNEAINIGQGNSISRYFYDYYPNNIGGLMLYNVVFKICNLLGIKNYLNILIIINIIFIDSAIVALLYLIKNLYTLQTVALMSIIMIFVTPLYCYVTIVYTDTLTMIFPILSFVLYYKVYQSNNVELKKKIFYMILIGILLTIGSIVKMNVVITLVAMLVHSFFTQKNKQFLTFFIIMLSCFISLNKVYSYQVQKMIPIPYEEAGLPATHWIMMGLKDNGRYNLDEANFSISLKDQGYSKEKIMEENLNIIKSRIIDYGIPGMINHIREKIDFTWGDGTYYSIDKLRREPLNSNVIQTYVFGDKKEAFIMFNQVIHIIVLIGIILGAVANIYKLSFMNILSNITIFGVLLFLLIWETRSRYLVLYIPILLVSMIHGYHFLCDLLSKDEGKELENE